MFSLGFVILEIIFGFSVFGAAGEEGLKSLYLEEANRLSTLNEPSESRYHSLIKQKIFLASEIIS